MTEEKREIVFNRCRAKRPGPSQTSDGNAYNACPGTEAVVIRRTQTKGGTVYSVLRCTTCGQNYSLP